MRSCLRRPLAPGSSRVRAILVSSVMFFSFSSEIVMFTYGEFAEGRAGGNCGNAPKGAARYAARRCASVAVSGSRITSCRSESAIRFNTSLVVS